MGWTTQAMGLSQGLSLLLDRILMPVKQRHEPKLHFLNHLVMNVPENSDRAYCPPPRYLTVYEFSLRARYDLLGKVLKFLLQQSFTQHDKKRQILMVKLVNEPISGGIGPERLLQLKSSNVSFCNFLIDVGSQPINEAVPMQPASQAQQEHLHETDLRTNQAQPARSNLKSAMEFFPLLSSEHEPSSGGIEPEISVSYKAKVSKLMRFPISGGIGPDKAVAAAPNVEEDLERGKIAQGIRDGAGEGVGGEVEDPEGGERGKGMGDKARDVGGREIKELERRERREGGGEGSEVEEVSLLNLFPCRVPIY
ncbi:hypothetical protein M5K25_024606 [Dendrobium thyrsiflorum]|uniref:Uncharacterized protein n=1 Tax=Dendrobium thyrsiflorum TaxID=117978 RepID=A0ABD0U2C9_DENTH